METITYSELELVTRMYNTPLLRDWHSTIEFPDSVSFFCEFNYMLVDTTFIVHYLFSPCSADDISSDFTLRGINVQCIHGDRYAIINLQHVWLINAFIVVSTEP